MGFFGGSLTAFPPIRVGRNRKAYILHSFLFVDQPCHFAETSRCLVVGLVARSRRISRARSLLRFFESSLDGFEFFHQLLIFLSRPRPRRLNRGRGGLEEARAQSARNSIGLSE
jgi:hypothetical protein